MASKFVSTPQSLSKADILNTYRTLLRATFIAFKGISNTPSPPDKTSLTITNR